MRKIVAVIVSLALAIMLIPVGVFADEDGAEYNALVRKAATAFPEYAEDLLNPTCSLSTYANDSFERTLVHQETRPISDKEFITYTGYSDGLILLSNYTFDYDTNVTSDDGINASRRNVTIDISATCVVESYYTGVFKLKGFSYRLNKGYDVYDSITSKGTPTAKNDITYTEGRYVKNESAYGYAELGYSLNFQLDENLPGAVLQSNLNIYVGEDTMLIYHTDAG